MLARSTLIYAPAILAPRAAAFALVVLFSHALPRAEFGLYALTVVIGEMLDMAACNWLRLSLLRLDIADPRAWRDGLKRCLILGVATLLVLALPAATVCAALAPERFIAFTASVFAYALGLGALRLGLTMLQLLRRDAAYSTVEVSRAVLLLGASAIAVRLSLRFETLALVNGAVAGLGAGACLILAWRGLPPAAADAAPWRSRLGYGAPLIAVGAAASLVASADRLGLKLLASAAAVGAYAAAYALARAPLDVIANAVNQGGFPELMRRHEAGGPQAAANFTRDAFELQTLLLTGGAAGLVTLAPPLAETLLPADYRAVAVAAMPAVALGAVLLSLKTFVFDNVFHVLKRNLSQAATYLPAGLVTAAACVLLIPRIGVLGAAAAFALGSATGLAASAACAVMALPLRLRPWEAAKALVAAAAAGLAARGVAHLISDPAAALVFGTSGGAIAWGVVVLWVRPRALSGVFDWTDNLLPSLPWPIRRLSRMSPSEVVHRIREQALNRLDVMQPAGWTRFQTTDGPVLSVFAPVFDRESPVMLETANAEARRAMAGAFDYLGQAWPPLGVGWMSEGAWRLDPVTDRPWPQTGWQSASGLGDVKYIWELNRLPFLGAVGLAAANGDAEAHAFGYAVLTAWMEAHPPPRGLAWASGVEIASRVASVLWLVACAPPPTADDEQRVRAFLAASARHLARYPSLHSSANNHRVAELTGLFLAAKAIPDAPAASVWAAESRLGLERAIRTIFHPDGVGAEQSPSYAAYALEWFLLAALAADKAGEPFLPAYRQAISSAAEALRWTLDEAGRPPRIGDDDESRVLTLRQAPERRYVTSVIALARRWLGEPPLDPALHDEDARDLLGPPTSGAPVSQPTGGRTFSDGGLTIFRGETAKGVAVLTFDHGPLGHLSIAAHGHADALSVMLSWDEEAVLIDPGTYLYHSGGAARDALRGTAAHNTLCIDDSDQSRILGPFAWDRHARTTLLVADPAAVEAEHDGYVRRYGLRHRRRVEPSEPGVYRISDQLRGEARRPYSWSAGFKLGYGCKIAVEGRHASVVTPAGRRLIFSAEGDVGAGWNIRDVVCSPRFSVLLPTRRLILAGDMAEGSLGVSLSVTVRLSNDGET